MALDRIRTHLRQWLLTEDEREIVRSHHETERKLDTVSSDLKDLSGEWSELHRALENADVIDDGAIIENADILVLTGRNHVVDGGEFGKPLYVNGKNHQISHCRLTDGDGL